MLRAHAMTGHMPTCGGPSLPIALGSAWGELRWLFSHLIHLVSGQGRTRLFPGHCSAYSKLHETDLEDASLRTCTAVRSHRPKQLTSAGPRRSERGCQSSRAFVRIRGFTARVDHVSRSTPARRRRPRFSRCLPVRVSFIHSFSL